MFTEDGFSPNSGFTEILCTAEKPPVSSNGYDCYNNCCDLPAGRLSPPCAGT